MLHRVEYWHEPLQIWTVALAPFQAKDDAERYAEAIKGRVTGGFRIQRTRVVLQERIEVEEEKDNDD